MALKKNEQRPRIVNVEIEVPEVPNLNQIATSLHKFGAVKYISYSERGGLF